MTAHVRELPNFLSLIKEKQSDYDTVIINLDKKLRTGLDIYGGNFFCKHLEVKHSSCIKCGAFVGFFGHEDASLMSYTHINLICSSIDAENIFVIHERVIPVDYKIYSQLDKKSVKYHRQVLFMKDKIVNIYSKTYKKDQYSFINKNYLDWIISLKSTGQILWVNPTKEESTLGCNFISL